MTPALPGSRLTVAEFSRLATAVAGYPYLKVVVDRAEDTWHLIDGAHPFHVNYIARRILGMTRAELARNLDAFNDSVYRAADRRFLLGVLALHERDERFFSLETVEVDTMDAATLLEFYRAVRAPGRRTRCRCCSSPRTTARRATRPTCRDVPRILRPRAVLRRAVRAAATRHGDRPAARLPADEELPHGRPTPLRWYDIIAMHRVPDDIPRLAGIINAQHTTPLSHTNVLAAGWGIPNAIQLGAFDRIADARPGRRVGRATTVDRAAPTRSRLTPIERPADLRHARPGRRSGSASSKPEVARSADRRAGPSCAPSDRDRTAPRPPTSASCTTCSQARLARLLGFYRVPRPPREDLLGYLARLLGAQRPTDRTVRRRRTGCCASMVGCRAASPCRSRCSRSSSSPRRRIQQGIGKLKMALELDAREVDPLCLQLQR